MFARSAGPLVMARKILDSVLDGSIDVGPLDAYWHLLIRRHRPDLVSGIRVLASTALAPMPAFVAGAQAPADTAARLKRAFEAAPDASWFPALADPLCLRGFAAVDAETYAPTLAWAREAEAAGYPVPA